MHKTLEELFAENALSEGDKVRLDMHSITTHPDYIKLTEKYKTWVHAHVDEVFTVIYDEQHRDSPLIVALQEDDSDPRWLFFIGHLKKVTS